ncbi:ANTAR domain-containing protein [Arthrobacter sp. Soil764]|uniref:ANTAR domain-containing protein n=1 Tax=Arthrobacter sp. Soil764 TaxID=1736403 RepID=UPI00070042B3|nr:ANTAR domain-containing protein [Arthrobacter sp. Soil764]KRE91913.1 antitermination regulator [Arthrobacter sp. Soil764]
MAGGPANNAEPERQGFLLDLVTGADDDAASLQQLAVAASRWISATAGSAIECATVLHRQRSCPASAGSTPAAASLAAEDENGDGPAAMGLALPAPAVVSQGGTRWQTYRRRLMDRGFGAALAVPLELQPGSAGALVFLGPADYVFSAKVVDEAAWFAGVASHSLKLALDVHGVIRAGDNLKQVLESRTSIDVACGVLMAQNRCSYAEAFGKLAGTSRHRNLKVRSVAEGILRSLPSGAPVTRFEPPAIA